ncbi:MAG: hypothetical protein N4J56_003736 [Chroococcidiopsis sp. SAG 2025]|uniref:hypothetical protein n=1 Tax=Chroococcidiopsis sp. SAG 2025 TaxID=171389 RepID=UPI002936FBF4|nr:hypothetical protein [Chroococcidiopsis sp. SAG 2025]MDV2994082.1 hypothetical protein [Chroococcidiopsis sp. SAG 2025]
MTPKLKLVTTNGQAASRQPLSMAVGIPNKKHIPAGAIITSQSDVENLPIVAQSHRHPNHYRQINSCQNNSCQNGKHPLLKLVA